MYRKTLKTLFLSVFIVGVGFTLFPFMKSLEPNISQISKLPYVDVSGMKSGETKVFTFQYAKIIITKEVGTTEKYTALSIPFQNGEYFLPEFDWSRPALGCESFIQKDGYYCLDINEYGFLWFDFMRWDLKGKYIGDSSKFGVIPDIKSIEFEQMPDQLLLLEM
ncbi:hypothetical protein FE810_15585 [Thalassotalea litorea]|uniref:Uncharacterized protein n=1 Tax=Thalassotalea litorea TaxID=2020715 RepID=A0A5R9ICJ7_9GAMM|nr:hypothetical protein [Thalassotalea litorea]TLU61093.1 hypothetical protein FE810_15585 [Thalassotalea litorea]